MTELRANLYRVQAADGRGPWRPGLSKHWSDNDSDRPLQTAVHEQILDAAEQLCCELRVDVIPREKVHFTTELPDSTLAVTQMDVRDVWFSTQILLRGLDEFLSCYLNCFADFLSEEIFGLRLRVNLFTPDFRPAPTIRCKQDDLSVSQTLQITYYIIGVQCRS